MYTKTPPFYHVWETVKNNAQLESTAAIKRAEIKRERENYPSIECYVA